jgi:hypothetical protein
VSSLQDISTFFTTTYPFTTLSWNCFSSPAVAIFSTSWRSNTGQPHSTTLIHAEPVFNVFRPTHDPSIDTFKIEYILAPCLVLSLLFNYKFTFSEILWSFSIWLEAVAILPQLFMLQRTGEAETITTHYLAALGAYRALYIPNWIFRYVITDHVRAMML